MARRYPDMYTVKDVDTFLKSLDLNDPKLKRKSLARLARETVPLWKISLLDDEYSKWLYSVMKRGFMNK